MRIELATRVEENVLAAVNELARAEGRQIEELVDEALADLVAKHNSPQPREDVIAAYMTSHERYAELYRKLAK
ncbi:MAG: hypothetical protein FJW38_08995 [Acidobacteria bacterium]|nr:hypothetical protein [Acidobacteriota bacterium]